jgi:hypothetical protein
MWELTKRDAEIVALKKQVRDQGDVIANYAKSDDIEQSEYDRMKARLCDERIAGLRIYDDVLKERTHVADLEKDAARLTTEIDKLHEITLGIMAERDEVRGELARAQAQLARYSRAIAERDSAEESLLVEREELRTSKKSLEVAEAAFIETAAQSERSRQCMVAAQEQTRLQAEAFAAREADLEAALKGSVSADVFNMLRAERDDLEAAIAERALDTERLEFAMAHLFIQDQVYGGGAHRIYTDRAAIDAARENVPKEAPDAER